MAQQLDIPVIEVAQLSREHGKRDDHRPKLFDLKQSGDVENNSNVVILVYRESYFLPEEERRAAEDGGCPAEIIVAKNRAGETGTVNAAWLGYRTLFVPDPTWVSTYGASASVAGGIIEYPTLDPSAFGEGAAAPGTGKTNGAHTNGSAGLPIHPQALLTFARSRPAGITCADVQTEFGVSTDIARAALRQQVAEGELEEQGQGTGRANRYLIPDLAALLFDERYGDMPFSS